MAAPLARKAGIAALAGGAFARFGSGQLVPGVTAGETLVQSAAARALFVPTAMPDTLRTEAPALGFLVPIPLGAIAACSARSST